jgi:hypothetical protein
VEAGDQSNNPDASRGATESSSVGELPKSSERLSRDQQSEDDSSKSELLPRYARPILPNTQPISLTDWIVAISTVVIMIWAGLQWYEMHMGGIDTHELAVTAKAQSESAGKQADAAKAQSDESKKQVEAMQETLRKYDSLIRAATTQASAAENLVKATNRNFQMGNRAYVGAKDAIFLKIDSTGKAHAANDDVKGLHFLLEADLFNTGNSPAKNVSGWAHVDVIPRPKNWELIEPSEIREEGSKRDIPKDGKLVYARDRILTEPEHKRILMGTDVLLIYGIVNYDDIFGGKDWTNFCFFWNPHVNDMSSCDGHNHMK